MEISTFRESKGDEVETPKTRRRNTSLLWNWDEAIIKEQLIELIIQYLEDEEYTNSIQVLREEFNLIYKKAQTGSATPEEDPQGKREEIKRLRKLINEGDWTEVEKMIIKYGSKDSKPFLYALYKHCYLELIEKQEFHKAFTFLTNKLKPLESRQINSEEMRELSYLLTAKSPSEISEEFHSNRDKLYEHLQSMFHLNDRNTVPTPLPPKRLLQLLFQAIAYQIENTYHPPVTPKVKTLLEDYRCFVLPNSLKNEFVGHKYNVKCVEFVGDNGHLIASGSSDNTLKLWNTKTSACLSTLHGHRSRIWDVSSNRQGNLISTASGDSTIKLWRVSDEESECVFTLKGHEEDVYTTRFHPAQNHIVSGGYDKTVRLFDVRTGALLRTFVGHNAPVSRAIFNPYGNLVISGSKDSTIRFWDISSGVCIKTISSHLGEVTSVEINSSGTLLLTGSKDNSNRLWETATGRPIKRYKGHQNTSKNFVRSRFGPDEATIISGSEDGVVYLWDIESGDIIQRLKGHSGMVYSVSWNERQSLLVSCSHDNTLRTWWQDESTPRSFAPRILKSKSYYQFPKSHTGLV